MGNDRPEAVPAACPREGCPGTLVDRTDVVDRVYQCSGCGKVVPLRDVMG